MSMNPALYLVGPAKQTGRGVPAVAPTFTHGLVTGAPFNPSISNEDVKETGTSRMTTVGSYRKEITYNASLGILGHADVLGLYLLGALGDLTTTGAASPYTHVFESGGTLPYLSIFSKLDAEDTNLLQDAKVGTFELAWEGVGPLDFKADIAAAMGKWLAAGEWTGPAIADEDQYFVCAGMTADISATTGTPGVIAGIVKSGSIKIDNALEPVYGAGSVEAKDIKEGNATASGKVTLAPDNATLARSILTGTTSGLTVSDQQVEGSLKWSFKHNTNAAWTIDVEAAGIPFAVSSIEADPNGGIAECDIDFSKAKSVTITLKNGVASY